MKKIILTAIILVASIFAQAQKLDAIINNGISNVGLTDEMNFRELSIDVCPIRIGEGTTLFGFYAETGGIRLKNETQKWISSSNNWSAGVSLNTTFGAGEYDGGWFLKTRLGFGQATTRSDVAAYGYQDKQVDFNLSGYLNIAIFDPDAIIFSRHSLEVKYKQPLSAKKELFFKDIITEIGDSLTWNGQMFQARFTETVANLFISDNWSINFDLMAGFGLEHPVVGLDKSMKYFTVGGGVSFFKLPYFQQNILEIIPEYQIMENSRFILKFKVNLVPVIFLIWDKFNFDVKLSCVDKPVPNFLTEGRV
jgi:hypothetical protein